MPLWLKLVHTAIVAVVVPVNWRMYGVRNFLWFSDVALLLMLPAVWMGSALLAGCAALACAAPELVWDFDFAARLIGRRTPLPLAAYMFDPKRPLWLRAVSLFHLWLQAAVFLALSRLGYDGRALILQTLIAWTVLLLSARFATPDENINLALGPGGKPPWGLSPRAYLALEMAIIPLLVYLPTHFALKALFA